METNASKAMKSFDVIGDMFDWVFDVRSKSWEREFDNGVIGKIQLVDTYDRFYKCSVVDKNGRQFFYTQRVSYEEAKSCVEEHAFTEDYE